MTTNAYIPHIPAQLFHFDDRAYNFRKTFEKALETMWANWPKEPGKILTEAQPTFNLVTCDYVVDHLNRNPSFQMSLKQRTSKELGPLMKVKLKWDELKPEQLRHQESNLPADLPEGIRLFTPRPHIYSEAIYFTEAEARAIGLPGFQTPFRV